MASERAGSPAAAEAAPAPYGVMGSKDPYGYDDEEGGGGGGGGGGGQVSIEHLFCCMEHRRLMRKLKGTYRPTNWVRWALVLATVGVFFVPAMASTDDGEFRFFLCCGDVYFFYAGTPVWLWATFIAFEATTLLAFGVRQWVWPEVVRRGATRPWGCCCSPLQCWAIELQP
eukprot:gene3273-31422_t